MARIKKVTEVEETVETMMIPGVQDVQEESAPKKRGRKPKNAEQKTETGKEATEEKVVKKKKTTKKVAGGWNTTGLDTSDDYDTITYNMYIEIELLTDALGMMPADKDILDKYIASRAPDAPSKTEEIELLGEEEVANRQTTIWPKAKFFIDEKTDHAVDVYFNRNNQVDPESLVTLPFLYNYQMRGLFKDACGLLARAKNNESMAIYKGYKKVIDGNIFVFPRHIAFQVPEEYTDEFGDVQKTYDKDGRLNILQRPIRISGPTGERTAINSSEFIPAGSRCKLRIGMTNKCWRDAVEEWLNYGLVRGIGQWRNSSSGLFRWRELDENWMPLN